MRFNSACSDIWYNPMLSKADSREFVKNNGHLHKYADIIRPLKQWIRFNNVRYHDDNIDSLNVCGYCNNKIICGWYDDEIFGAITVTLRHSFIVMAR